jgi:hypothetical protein
MKIRSISNSKLDLTGFNGYAKTNVQCMLAQISSSGCSGSDTKWCKYLIAMCDAVTVSSDTDYWLDLISLLESCREGED